MAGATSEWRKLLGLALPALDHVFGAASGEAEQRGKPDWTLGGGTAIMLAIGHRVSHDVDVFVHGARLRRFSPHENPASKRISTLYDWPGHYLKFHRPEGEIDFLSGTLMTEPGFGWRDIEGRRVALEDAPGGHGPQACVSRGEAPIPRRLRPRGSRCGSAGHSHRARGTRAGAAPEAGRIPPRCWERWTARHRRQQSSHWEAGRPSYPTPWNGRTTWYPGRWPSWRVDRWMSSPSPPSQGFDQVIRRSSWGLARRRRKDGPSSPGQRGNDRDPGP